MDTHAPKEIDRATVWLDREMLRQAKMIGAARGESMSEVLEQKLRAPLGEEFRKLFTIPATHDLGDPGA